FPQRVDAFGVAVELEQATAAAVEKRENVGEAGAVLAGERAEQGPAILYNFEFAAAVDVESGQIAGELSGDLGHQILRLGERGGDAGKLGVVRGDPLELAPG